MPDDFETMWRDLAPVGRAAGGGYFRQPYAAAERELRAWFAEQCEARELVVEADGDGNLLGWWHPPGGSADRAVLTGSHLDSVLDGGAYDGPLGVVSSLAAVDLLRERGVAPARPLAVAAFAEEEGSRFGVACLGSRLAVGATTPEAARELRDRDGVALLDAMAAAGVEPGLGRASWLDRVGCAVELHVEQGRDLVHRERAVGLASVMWPHGRWRFDFAGEANHAGATRMEDRHDPMLTYAMTVLAANKQARLAGARATFGRVAVEPNGTNAVPSLVSAWLDARADTSASLEELVAGVARQAGERAERDGTRLEVTPESVSPEVAFDATLTARLAGLLGDAPAIPSLAGHDAGVLAAAGVPTAMLFVRNPTGVSHSPAEHAETVDCLQGVVALADALEELLR
ncbi:allantoate amidohydrolase [Nocardioides aequoreus]|uniref:allantoate amidohydrolase n=1 Tax=Nocardioides aequoreus TaxID=397278 RepID=UPI000AFD77B8|nr:allantoate amidohydrolase [Nocardioides aequoreus]